MAPREMDSDKMKHALDQAFSHQEKKSAQLKDDIEELRQEAAKGALYRSRIIAGAVIVGATVALAVGFVMFREPQYRSIFIFLLVCVLLSGALHFFRKAS